MRISDWSSDVCSSDLVAAQRYVRQGPWKMTRIANAFFPSAALLLPRQWQLYNIDTDRGATTDVAAENPEQVEKLTQAWAQRSEGRRVGKEGVKPGRSRRSQYQEKNKTLSWLSDKQERIRKG